MGCVFEVWPAPGAREGLPKYGGRSPPHFCRPSRGPGAAQNFKNAPHKFRPDCLQAPGKLKIKNKIKFPSAFGPESAPNLRFPWDNCSPDPFWMHWRPLFCSPKMALELPSGADFGCNRHCKTNPVDLEGSRGQVLVVFGGLGGGHQFAIVAKGRLRLRIGLPS